MRLKWKAVSIFSTWRPRRAGRWTFKPCGNFCLIVFSASSMLMASRRRTSTRSIRPKRLNAHCAAAISISAKLPSSARAAPSFFSKPRTVNFSALSPKIISHCEPTWSACTLANFSVRMMECGSTMSARNSVGLNCCCASACNL